MIRTLMNAAYFAVFVGGLGWAEPNAVAPPSVPPATDSVLRTPESLDPRSTVNRGGALNLVSYASLRSTCENFDGYTYDVKGESIVIDSYVTITRNRFCAEVYRDNLRRDYVIQGLTAGTSYRIFFKDDTGALIDYGTTAF